MGPVPWDEQPYTLSFLSEMSLRREMEVVLRLLGSGLTWGEVRSAVLEENLFQTRRPDTARTRLKLLRRRLAWLDGELRSQYLRGEMEDRSVLLLCSFLAAYRLPREFVLEEVRYRWQKGEFALSRNAVTEFFQRKREQDIQMSRWDDALLNKARQVLVRQLREYHLLERAGREAPDRWCIRRLVPSHDLNHYLAESEIGRKYLEFLLCD